MYENIIGNAILLVKPEMKNFSLNFQYLRQNVFDFQFKIHTRSFQKTYSIMSLIRTAIPNRGATAHLSATKRRQGCRKIGKYCLFIYVLLHIVIFNQLGVPPNFFNELKGAANQKRLKKTALGYEK